MSALDNRADADSTYADGTVLTAALGNHAKVKILAALLSEADRDLNVTDVARLAGVDRSTFYEHVDDLLAFGLVERTREVGPSTMYQLNRDSEAATLLAKLEWELIEVAPAPEDGPGASNPRS